MNFESVSFCWLVVAIVAAIAEMLLPSFGVIFASVAAALVAGLTSLLNISLQAQVIIFALFLLASLVFLRPRLLKKLNHSKGVPEITEALVGKTGAITVVTDSDSGLGRALIEGNDWAVKCETGIAVNAKVIVVSSSGIVLNVQKI